jgi:hypothetical protein
VQEPEATVKEAHPSLVVLLAVASLQSFNLQALLVAFQKQIPSVPVFVQAVAVL